MVTPDAALPKPSIPIPANILKGRAPGIFSLPSFSFPAFSFPGASTPTTKSTSAQAIPTTKPTSTKATPTTKPTSIKASATSTKTSAASTATGNCKPQAASSDSTTENGVTNGGCCAELTVVFARGTSESGNVGTVSGPPMFKSLRSKLGADKVTVQGVDYPADNAVSLTL